MKDKKNPCWALILVDIQNDFLPGGPLAAKNGNEIIPVVNRVIPEFGTVVATQDWHPTDHESFAANHDGREVGEYIDLHGLEQILWPVHCVQESEGAQFAENLSIKAAEAIFRKGIDPGIDSYSGFFDNGHRRSTGLDKYLQEKEVDTVFIAGLTTEYCVKFTAEDALDLGFKTYVIIDACRPVEMKPGDEEAAIQEMKGKGIQIVRSEEIRGLV